MNNNMDQIIQNLSFEVVTIPQDTIPTTTSCSAPIKVKIKLKKTNDTNNGRQVFSVPKLKSAHLGKTRLVHSDETIMSFDINMEPEPEAKQRRKSQNKFFHLFKKGKCMDIESDDEDDSPYMAAASIKPKGIQPRRHLLEINNISQNSKQDKFNIKRPKEISKPPAIMFGKCKPGGCLDPPFGEDNYHYYPSANQKRECKEINEIKTLKLSSNNANEDTQSTTVSKTVVKDVDDDDKPEADISSTFMIYKASSKRSLLNEEYSDSIITYPIITSAVDLSILEKNVTSRKSSASRSKQPNTDIYFTSTKGKRSLKDLINKKKYDRNKNERITDNLQPKLNTIDGDHIITAKVTNLQESVPQTDILLQLGEVSEDILLNINQTKVPIQSLQGKAGELKNETELKEVTEIVSTITLDNVTTKTLDVIAVKKSTLNIVQDKPNKNVKLNRMSLANEIMRASAGEKLTTTTAKTDPLQSLSSIEMNNDPTTILKYDGNKNEKIIDNLRTKLNTLDSDHIIQENITNLQESVAQTDTLLQLGDISENILLNINQTKVPIQSFQGNADELKNETELKEVREIVNTITLDNVKTKIVDVIAVKKSTLNIVQDKPNKNVKLNRMSLANEMMRASAGEKLTTSTAKTDPLQSLSNIEMNSDPITILKYDGNINEKIINNLRTKINTLDSDHVIPENATILQESVPQLDHTLLHVVEVSDNALLNINQVKVPIHTFQGNPDKIKNETEINQVNEIVNTVDLDNSLAQSIEDIAIKKASLNIVEDVPVGNLKLKRLSTAKEIIRASTVKEITTTAETGAVQSSSSMEMNKDPLTITMPVPEIKQHPKSELDNKSKNLYVKQENLTKELFVDCLDASVKKNLNKHDSVNESLQLNSKETFSDMDKNENLEIHSDYNKQVCNYNSDLLDIGKVNDKTMSERPENIVNNFEEIVYKTATRDSHFSNINLMEQNSSKIFSSTSSTFNTKKSLSYSFKLEENPNVMDVIDVNENNNIKANNNSTNSFKETNKTEFQLPVYRNMLLQNKSLSNNIFPFTTSNKAISETKLEPNPKAFPPPVMLDTVNLKIDISYIKDDKTLAMDDIKSKSSHNLLHISDIINPQIIPEIVNATNPGQFRDLSFKNISNIKGVVTTSSSSSEFKLHTIFKGSDIIDLATSNEIKTNNLIDDSETSATNSDLNNEVMDTYNKIKPKQNTVRENFLKNEAIPHSATRNNIQNVTQHLLLETSLYTDSASNDNILGENESAPHVKKKRNMSRSSNNSQAINDILIDTNLTKQQNLSERSSSYIKNQKDITETNVSRKPSRVMDMEKHLENTEDLDILYNQNLTSRPGELRLDHISKKPQRSDITRTNIKATSDTSLSSYINTTNTEKFSENLHTMPNIRKYSGLLEAAFKKSDLNEKLKDLDRVPLEDTVKQMSKTLIHGITQKAIRVDLGFQTYVNENADTIVKTFDASHEPKRFSEDKVSIFKSIVKFNDNELTFAINSDTRVSIKIDRKNNMDNVEEWSCKIKDASAKKDNEQYKKGKSEMHINMSTMDILKESLSHLYENDLVPMEEVIKSLRLEVDRITKHRHLLRKKSAATTKKQKPMYSKRCVCNRK